MNSRNMDLDFTSTLREFLEAHSVPTTPAGQELAAGNATMAAWVFRKPSTALDNLLQLDVCVNSPLIAGQTLIESFAGWGSSEAEAIKQAWHKFSQSSLHVLMEVFVGEKKGEDQIEWETWAGASTKWRVCLGPLFAMSFVDKPLPDLRCGDLLDMLRDTLLPTLEKKYHWLRFYYMRQGSLGIGSECLLNNDSWSEGQTIIDQWKWPDGSYSVRLFLILVPNIG
jgi:hypothetical protein